MMLIIDALASSPFVCGAIGLFIAWISDVYMTNRDERIFRKWQREREDS